MENAVDGPSLAGSGKAGERPRTVPAPKLQSAHQGQPAAPSEVYHSDTIEPYITINVGGTVFQTSRDTLTRFPDSMLGCMFSGQFPATLDTKGSFFIDRDPTHFRTVLNFCRDGECSLPESAVGLRELLAEANYYQIQPLCDYVIAATTHDQTKMAKTFEEKFKATLVENGYSEFRGWLAEIMESSVQHGERFVVMVQSGHNMTDDTVSMIYPGSEFLQSIKTPYSWNCRGVHSLVQRIRSTIESGPTARCHPIKKKFSKLFMHHLLTELNRHNFIAVFEDNVLSIDLNPFL